MFVFTALICEFNNWDQILNKIFLSLFGIFSSFKLKKKINFGAKIPEGLSYALNAAISVASDKRDLVLAISKCSFLQH
jgi:hypothetical protein